MSLTKAQVMQAFSVMDVATLNKLYTYSQMLIIPDQNLLVNATKAQMEAWVVANAPSLFPAWTAYYDKSDFGWFLVELFALFSEKDFWYINAFANEALLPNSHVYSAAFIQAVTLGYSPKTCAGASAKFNVTFPAGAETTYLRGQLVISLPGANNLQFSNDEDFTVPASAAPQTIPLTLYEGQQAASTVSYNGNSVVLTQLSIDTESIDVQDNGVDWRRVRVFGESNNTSMDYIVLPEANGSAGIEFGSDGFGVQPGVGDSVTVYFRTCSGSGGNVSAQAANISQSNASLAPIGVTMMSDATGGADPESLASLKNNAVLYFQTRQAAINTAITEQIINQYAGVQQSNAYVIGPNVYFQVIPADGSVASATLLAAIQTYLTPFLMLGYQCASKPVNYVSVAPLSVTISVLAGYDGPTAVQLATQLIQDYTDPRVLAVFGGTFDLTALNLLIKAQVPGVQNVIFNEVQGTTPENVTMDNTSILQVIDPETDLTINYIPA